jgi:hypothetical protein
MNNFNNFPVGYNPYQQMQQMQQTQQNINTFFMRAKTVDDAKQYPLAPNSTAIFIGENNTFCCFKSLGSSPFDTPVFIEFYRKQEQEIKQEAKEEITQNQVEYATKQELNSYIEQFNIIGNNFSILKKESDSLRKELENIKNELGIKENKNAE